MDRVNRRFLVFSTSIAIPFALLMVSLCSGTSPEDQPETRTQLAVGTGSSSATDGDIQQVAGRVIGKQIETGPSRGGLLRLLGNGDSRSTSSNKRQTSSRSTGNSPQPRGLLDTLFSDGSSNSSDTTQPRSSNRSSVNRSSTSTRSTGSASNNGDVNWDGIPFHAAATNNTKTQPTPIRDPGQAKPSTTTARVIRGGNATSPRTSSAGRESAPLSVPVPPRESEPVPSSLSAKTVTTSPRSTSSSSLSNVNSSRRSNRREVDAFTAAQTTPSVSRTVRPAPPQDEVVDLVPRVSRRVIETPSAAVAAASSKEKEPAVAPEKAPAPAIAVKSEPKPASNPVVVAKAQPKPASVEAKPASESTTASTTEPIASVPSAKLNPPTAYTKPVDPATTPVPMPTASFTNQPYAASTPVADYPPAESVSHRAGPPASAFTNTPTNGMATNYGPAAMSPTAIGSGLNSGRPYSNNASPAYPGELVETPGYHGSNQAISQGYGQGQGAGWGARQTNPPAYETAQAPTDPYGHRYARPSINNGNSFNASGAFNDRNIEPFAGTAQASPNMATRGQSLDRNAGAMSNRPAEDTTGIPMRPIAGYAAQNSAMPAASTTPVANKDNFAQTPYDPTNRMRLAKGSSVPSSTRVGMVSSELPGIRVVTHGPDQVMIRQTNEYEIRVENRGAIDADGLIVRAMIPDWAEVQGQNATRGDVDTQAADGTVERLIWKIDHLPAGTSEQLFVRLMAARSGTHNVDVDWTLMPQKSVATVHVHEPQLGLTIEGPDQVVYGQSQTYRVRVLNPGDGVAPNVVFTLSPESKTPQSQRIGDIPPGKEAQFDVELTAQDLGDLKIHGLAIGDLELRAEAHKSIRVAAAKIEAMLNGPELKYQNTEALYNLQLQNLGTATTERVVATLRIPAGAKYLGGIEGAELRGNTLRWEIASLEPSATRDYQFRCNMAATGEHLFSFDCKGTAAGYADVALSTKVESIADLVLTINDPVAPAPIGSEVSYEIIVRNRGSREARDVKTLAQFSHGIEPQRIEGQSGEVVTGQVLFDPIPRIGAGEEVRLRVVAIADRAGHHRFRTEVRSGDTVLVAEEATHYMSPQADRVSRRSTDGKQIR